MDKLRSPATDALFEAILSLETVDECYRFFEDACTIKEILDISQRFEVAGLLSEKKNYQEISKETGASTATISRVGKCLSYGSDGYKLVLDRLEEKKKIESELARANKMLANESFVAKAPQKLIDGEKEKVIKYTELLEKVEESLAKFN